MPDDLEVPYIAACSGCRQISHRPTNAIESGAGSIPAPNLSAALASRRCDRNQAIAEITKALSCIAHMCPLFQDRPPRRVPVRPYYRPSRRGYPTGGRQLSQRPLRRNWLDVSHLQRTAASPPVRRLSSTSSWCSYLLIQRPNRFALSAILTTCALAVAATLRTTAGACTAPRPIASPVVNAPIRARP